MWLQIDRAGAYHGQCACNGDYSAADPNRSSVDAVANGDVDDAVVWGPLAGYYAKRARAPLTLMPVTPQSDGESLAWWHTTCSGRTGHGPDGPCIAI